MDIPKNTGTSVLLSGGRHLQISYDSEGWNIRILERVPNPVIASINKTILQELTGSRRVLKDNDADALEAYMSEHKLTEYTGLLVEQMASSIEKAQARGARSKEALSLQT